MPPLVDVHSHVVPSGDDGAQTIDEGVMLCRTAAECGTGLLFATPHVWNHLRLTEERERDVRAALAEVAERAGLELRLGFELTPHARLLEDDLRRYELEGTGAVLLETPFFEPLDLLVALGEKAEAAGLRPVIAHPERIDVKFIDPEEVIALARRGWLLQVNGPSLTGQHGARAKELAWQLVEGGHVSLAGSDGHRRTRPVRIDDAHELVRERLGETTADAIFGGAALGLAARPPAVETAG